MTMDLKRLAKIGKGTRRKKRDINLLDLAKEIKSIYEEHNSLKKTSNVIKLSPEMIRQFLKINDLDGRVKDLIKKDLITSVDISYRISKIKESEQIILAKAVIDRDLSSNDVRAIVKFKINHPKIPISNVIEKVIQSKDRKIYVAYLGIEKQTFTSLSKKIPRKTTREKIIYSIFKKVVSSKQIESFRLNGRVVIIKVQKEGKNKLKNKAKELNVPLARLADALIKEHLSKS